jgi:hypothetical protein
MNLADEILLHKVIKVLTKTVFVTSFRSFSEKLLAVMACR